MIKKWKCLRRQFKQEQMNRLISRAENMRAVPLKTCDVFHYARPTAIVTRFSNVNEPLFILLGTAMIHASQNV